VSRLGNLLTLVVCVLSSLPSLSLGNAFQDESLSVFIREAEGTQLCLSVNQGEFLRFQNRQAPLARFWCLTP
jgi:hypothetical protein